MLFRYVISFFIFFGCSGVLARTLTFQPNQKIDWNDINDGDVVCLIGERIGTLRITKNITLDGNCYSQNNLQGSLTGLVTPQWQKSIDDWRTVEKFPLKYGRYSSWILKDGKLIELDDANVYREGDYFYSREKPHNIKIPKYYSGIVAKGTTKLTIKNLNIHYYHTNAARFTNTSNTTVDNLNVSWFGGGINPSGFPRAGDGITFDGNTSNAWVKNSHAFQCFDTGFAIQLFKPRKEFAKNLRFINISTDMCSGGISVATHKRGGSVIDDVEVVGAFTNLGYGWSGMNNTVHGRGVLILQHEESKITNIKIHDSVIDKYSWVGILHAAGELDAWNNTIMNGTGEYAHNRYIQPAAYTAHGKDYTRDVSDDEAIGSFHDNTIINNNGYALQVIHNRPKQSTRQLTIKNNKLSGNKAQLNLKTSNDFIK